MTLALCEILSLKRPQPVEILHVKQHYCLSATTFQVMYDLIIL